VRVLFPACEGTSSRAQAAERAAFSGTEPGSVRKYTILVVDDEEPVRRLCVAFAERLGYLPISAADGEEALEVFRRRSHEIDCVVLDLTMPRMDGVRTFREMKRFAPEIPVVLSSGYNEEHARSLFGNEGLAGFMEKPYRLRAFEEKVKSILSRRPTSA
jgi:two-component system, cell cycle sensor histidine kinase and response regulator CckA